MPLGFSMEVPGKKSSWLFFACSAVLLLLLSSVLQRQLQAYRPGPATVSGEDFPIYYVAGKVARSPGDRMLYYPASDGRQLSIRNLLDPVPQDTPWAQLAHSVGFQSTGRFMAPPFTALLAAPLTRMPPRTALLFWRLASTLMLVLAIYLTCGLTEANWHLSGLFVIGVAAAFSFFPFIETLYQGQVDALVLLLWVLGVCFVQTKASVSSAFCFAVATMIKVSPALAIGIFLLRRQWRWLAAYVLWMLTFLGIGVWQLGWQNHLDWFRRVLPMLSGGVPYFASKSLPSFVMDLYIRQVPLDYRNLPLIPPSLRWLTRGMSFMLIAGTLFFFWKRCRSARNLVYELAVLPLVILIASPESFRHHYLLAALPLLFIWDKSRHCSDRWSSTQYAALALSTLAIGTVFADYLLIAIRNPLLDLCLSAIVPAATLLLIYLALRLPDTSLSPATLSTASQPGPAAILSISALPT